jgi:hypothetical protein
MKQPQCGDVQSQEEGGVHYYGSDKKYQSTSKGLEE